MSTFWSYIFGGSTKSGATSKANGSVIVDSSVPHKDPIPLSTEDWIIVDSSENVEVSPEVREEEFETIAESVASLAEFSPTLSVEVCHVSLEDLKEVVLKNTLHPNATVVQIEQPTPVEELPDEVTSEQVAIPPPVTARMLGIVGSQKPAVVISRKSVRKIQKQRNRVTQYSKPHNNQAKINCQPWTYAKDSKTKREKRSKR